MKIPVESKDMQCLVVLILVDTVERDFDDSGDNLRDLVANWKVEVVRHFAPFATAAQEQNKTPAHSQESSAFHFGRRLWRIPSP
jgi:hypothetical protein